MNETRDTNSPHEPVPAQKKRIHAKEFVAAFLEKPDDFHLMEKYGITPKQLEQIYCAVLKNGLLSDFEYSQREKKSAELEDRQQVQLSASATVRLVEEPSEVLTQRITESGYSFDEGLRDAISQSLEDKRRQIGKPRESDTHRVEKVDRCPRCDKPKDPSSPVECMYCGVVFKKA
jgi:hypothetical protein